MILQPIATSMVIFAGYFYASKRVDETNGNPHSNQPAAVKILPKKNKY